MSERECDREGKRERVCAREKKTVRARVCVRGSLTPPPLELSGHNKISSFFFRASKTVFFLCGQSLTPSPPS